MSTPPVTEAAVRAAMAAGNEHDCEPGYRGMLPPILGADRVRRMLEAAAPHMVWEEPRWAHLAADFVAEPPPQVVHIRDTDEGISGDSIR